MKKRMLWLILIVTSIFAAVKFSKKVNLNPQLEIGQKVDSLNGVFVYYNGSVGNVSGRNTAPDGYNIGLKWQCVEFVKRYYFEKLNHKMPDAFGNAKDFFDAKLEDSTLNVKRNLTQFKNGSISKPKVEDLLIYDGTLTNSYGHVSIVSYVNEREIEIIQQNPGPFGKPRERFSLTFLNGKWVIGNDRILGWLRIARL
jgi:surface antigen